MAEDRVRYFNANGEQIQREPGTSGEFYVWSWEPLTGYKFIKCLIVDDR